MATEEEFGERAKRILRAEMVRTGIGYDALAEKLTAMELPETAVNLRNKISRGKFTAAFLLAVCDALEVTILRTQES